MRRSSRIGFGASVGLAIVSASFIADFSAEPQWLSFWSQASAGIWGASALIEEQAKTPDWGDGQVLLAKVRRRALLDRVHQKLNSRSGTIDSILP